MSMSSMARSAMNSVGLSCGGEVTCRHLSDLELGALTLPGSVEFCTRWPRRSSGFEDLVR